MRFTHSDLLAYQARRSAKVTPPFAGKGCDDEGELHRQIEDHLKSLGSRCYYVHSRMDRPSTVKSGTPDFVGWIDGKPFAWELKKRGKKPTIEQLGELRWAELAGASVSVVRSFEEFLEVVK